MSSELERRLREARETLPEPDATSTERARESALAAIRQPSRRRVRTVAFVTAVSVMTLLLVGLAGASFLRQPFTASQPATSRVVDRTFVCTHAALGDLKEIEARAGQGIREGRSKWKQLPFAVVATGRATNSLSRWGRLTYSYAWITAGEPSSTTTIDSEWRKIGVPATLGVSATACTRATSHVPLSAAGLSGGVASPFGEEFDCSTPRRFLVRVRAVLRSPAALRARQGFLATNAPVREARLAVRTLTGRPLVYAEAFDSGKTRLLTAKSCFREG
ncbi:MAG: hypothetical protein H0U08_02785 [Actinobacteria bacterium]|nr:hypothetical protein [Actinomycetota bacterium]